MRSSQIRRIFLVELFRLICVVWPILSGVLFAMVGPGFLIGHIGGGASMTLFIQIVHQNRARGEPADP
jgi:hypothetical protein